jgi:hypothetical protein
MLYDLIDKVLPPLAVACLLILAFTALKANIDQLRSKTRKGYMKAMLLKYTREIWEFYFKRDQLRALREDTRNQYDRVHEAHQQNQERLNAESAKPAKEQDAKLIEGLQASLQKSQPDIDGLKQQLADYDRTIDSDDPNSIAQQIEARRALIVMLKAHIKHL